MLHFISALTSKLYQLAVQFLQGSNQVYMNDAEFDLSEIKLHLSSQKDAESSLQQFELLYSKINNSVNLADFARCINVINYNFFSVYPA